MEELERFTLAKERIEELLEEKREGEIGLFFDSQFRFAEKLFLLYAFVESGKLKTASMEKLQEMNRELYAELEEKAYETSFLNPTFAVDKLGEYGQHLCFLAAQMWEAIPACFTQNREEFLICQELLLEVYQTFVCAWEEGFEGPEPEALQEICYWYVSDYSEPIMEQRIREQVDPSCDFFTKIIMESDLDDLRYLYYFGEPVSENEIRTASFLNSLPEERIQMIADTYTEGYRIGFEVGRKDLSKKKTVNIRSALGFERVIRKAIENFDKMGLQPTICRSKKGVSRSGYQGALIGRQFDYDHKDDMGLFWDGRLLTRKLEVLRASFEQVKELANAHGGPAVLETFGEEDFTPKSKEEAIKLSEEARKISVEYFGKAAAITNEYIKGEERSFTIIAFPIPSIGDDFEEIFDEVIRINTLDYHLYSRIQETLIAALDQGNTVEILGKAPNKTRLQVKLHELSDPEKQTNFENCVADVNIPVGEVFTSPVLEGTNGTLHVCRVYLNGLAYENLELEFTDGMVTDYQSTNFDKKHIKNALLSNHDSVPMGEFAIGTNTTAYVLAGKRGYTAKLPILIAEKMGPHFAIGDTCYSYSEDLAVFNPDGKEIIARDNEKSLLRKTNPESAYFSCHTDITIPYDELQEISVVKENGERITIIEDGRFVLPGCEELNRPFEEE